MLMSHLSGIWYISGECQFNVQHKYWEIVEWNHKCVGIMKILVRKQQKFWKSSFKWIESTFWRYSNWLITGKKTFKNRERMNPSLIKYEVIWNVFDGFESMNLNMKTQSWAINHCQKLFSRDCASIHLKQIVYLFVL